MPTWAIVLLVIVIVASAFIGAFAAVFFVLAWALNAIHKNK